MENKYINFVLCGDKNFIIPITVAMTSILVNINKSRICRFFLFTTDFNENDINIILKLKNKYNFELINIIMLEKLEINNFRGIKNLNFDSFQNINIFTGKANVGKTSVLEAIYTILRLNAEAMVTISDLRSIIKDDDIFESMFYDYNLKNSIKLNAIINQEKIYIEIKPNINNRSITVPLGNQISKNDINFLNSLQFDIKNGKPSKANVIV